MSELFKIKGGKVRDIMAVGVVNKYKSGSGWEQWQSNETEALYS
jgi:hypothetical protein